MAERTGKEERTWVGGLAGKGYRKSRDQVISRTRERIMDSLSIQKTRTADFISGIASALRIASDQTTDQKQLSTLETLAADKVDDISRFLRTTEMDEFVQRAERVARRQPAILFGAAFVAGFLFARYLTNSNRSASGALSHTYASAH